MGAVPRVDRISDYVTHYAGLRPDQEALVQDPLRLTYRHLAEQVDAFARALLAQGVRKGDRVAMMGTPRPECYLAFLAVASIGGIFLGLNPKYPIGELQYFFEDATPRLLLGFAADTAGEHTETLQTLGAAPSVERVVVMDGGPPAPGWDAWLAEGSGVSPADLAQARGQVEGADPALIVYTSGSTGNPKGAVLTHRGLAMCGRNSFTARPTDPARILCNLPVNHVGYMSDICGYGLAGGGTILFMERFDPGGILELIEKERLTAWGQVPTMFQMTVAHPHYATTDLSSLQRVIWSGAVAPRDLIETLAATTGAQLNTSYGLTESTGSVTRADPDASLDILADTIGRPIPECEVRIVHPDGKPVKPGEEGEIHARAEYLMQGYWNRPDATAETMDADGWLHTGDVVRLREDGNVEFRGRLSGMYKSGGENVYPREVELCLEAHPQVAMAAAFGVPDALYGEVGHAHVMSIPGGAPDPGTLREFCKERLANFKVPKLIVVQDALPMLPVGKVDKMALKRQALAAREVD